MTGAASRPSGAGGEPGNAPALIFFAYLGFDEIGNFAKEMRDPERQLPRALFVFLAGATAIYLVNFMLVNLSLLRVARRNPGRPRTASRVMDTILPVLALLMCGWLLLHTRLPSLLAAGGLVFIGLVAGRRRPRPDPPQ